MAEDEEGVDGAQEVNFVASPVGVAVSVTTVVPVATDTSTADVPVLNPFVRSRLTPLQTRSWMASRIRKVQAAALVSRDS
jgi:hypothetical protein